MSPDLAISVDSVVKSFGQVRALDGISLHVQGGEVYGLLGPNGSGKTTLIRSLLGLVVPESGSITVLDRTLPDRNVLSSIGYMTQAPALYPDLTILENLRFFAAIYGAEAGILAALDFVDLRDRTNAVVATLSGGTRTRVSLACALVHRPRLLLLDEPTVGVDPQLRHQLWDGFRAMAAEGTTIVVSSHVMDEAERCQRLGLLRRGKLLAEGTSAELRRMAGSEDLESAFLKLAEEVPAS
jgi:ABC-2 type transport system ATP-binding protein